MSEAIGKNLKRAAVLLSDTLDYVHAARTLCVSVEELKGQVRELESQLCVRLFKAGPHGLVLTEEGHFLTDAFRECKCCE